MCGGELLLVAAVAAWNTSGVTVGMQETLGCVHLLLHTLCG